MTSRRLQLLFSLLTGLTLSMPALPVSYYATQSRLATGRWVKIATTAEQMYQLSYDRLRELGFEHPERVQVFGYPGTDFNNIDHRFSESYTDDICPIATRHTADGRLIFFGGSDSNVTSARSTGSVSTFTVRRNYYDTASHYFLTEVDEVQPVYSRPAATVQASYPEAGYHIHIDVLEDELQSYNEGGCSVHGIKHAAGDNVPYTFSIKDYTPGTDNATACGSFFYRFGINANSPVSLSVTQAPGLSTPESIKPSNTAADAISDSQTDIAYYEAYGSMPFQGADGGAVADGQYTFTVRIPTISGNMKYCAADYMILRYPRRNRLGSDTPSLVMNLAGSSGRPGQLIRFTDVASGKLEVWNIDNATAYESLPVTYDTDSNSGHVVLRDNTARLVAFNPAATFPEPDIEGELAAQNLHAASTPEMLIITTAELEPLARQLADAHRRHGLDVMVTRHNLIYNEFSSGNRHPMAYRRMAKMFFDRDPGRFRYLMFFGPAHYDARNLFTPKADRMVCYMQDDPQLTRSKVFNFAADSYFAILADDYDHSRIHYYPYDIAVGRASAINAAQASIYVDKAVKHLDKAVAPDTYSRVLLLSGKGDNALHGSHSKEVFSAMSADNDRLNFVTVPEELYPESTPELHERLIAQALRSGCGYMTYSGHGNPSRIQMWSTNAVNTTRYDHPTFAVFSSCDQFSFDRMYNCLVETMLFQAGGGAIGGYAADRSVYINYNQLSCISMARAYAQARPGDTFGDMYIHARDLSFQMYDEQNLEPAITPLRNMLSYNLAGDPALPVGVPGLNAGIDRIGDYSLPGESPVIEPLRPTVFYGSILDNEGNLLDSFNGTANITIYDGEHTAATTKRSDESKATEYKPIYFSIGSDILTTCQADVKDGRFSAEISCPLPVFTADTYRISVSASDNEGNSASGCLNTLRIAEFDYQNPDIASLAAPAIRSLGVGDTEAHPGAETSASATVYAVIDPSPSGLCFQNGGVKSRTRITIDNNIQFSSLENYITRRADGYFDLAVPVSDLADGTHTLQLQVTNNAGMTDAQTIDFTVVTRAIDADLTVAEDPARTSATFDTESAATVERLIITDPQGRTVHVADRPAMPYKWDLRDADGAPCPDGLYKASVLLHDGRDYGNSRATSFVILKDK